MTTTQAYVFRLLGTKKALFLAGAVKTFLAYGMLLNTAAALELSEVDAEGAAGMRTRITAGLFDHITEETNR